MRSTWFNICDLSTDQRMCGERASHMRRRNWWHIAHCWHESRIANEINKSDKKKIEIYFRSNTDVCVYAFTTHGEFSNSGRSGPKKIMFAFNERLRSLLFNFILPVSGRLIVLYIFIFHWTIEWYRFTRSPADTVDWFPTQLTLFA